MPTTIDELQIEVEASASKADENLKGLTSTLEKLDKASKSSGLDKTFEKLNKIASLNFGNLSALNKLSNATRPMNDVSSKVKEVTAPITQSPTQVGTTIDTSGIADTVSEIESVTEAVNDIPNHISVAVDAPNAEVTTSKLSGVRSVIDRIKTSAATAGTPLNKFSGWLTKIGVSAKGSFKSLSRVFTRVLVFGTAFRVYRMVLSGISEGLQNISQYSNETSTAMSKLSTNSLYLKNSIGAMLYPVIVAITPALESMTNAIVRGLNAINEFLAAWTGTDVFIKAQKVVKQYGDTAQKTANQIKKSFAGMDEITVIGDKSGGASASAQPDPSQMFSTSPISATTSALVDNLKANIENLKAALGGAALVIGAILAFSGASIPLGLGLMVVGAVALGSAVEEKWGGLNATLQDQFTAIMLAISGALIVIGAILAFSGASTGLGLALMIGGAATLATAVAENWEGMPEQVKNTITIIGLAVGSASLVLGAILAFSGAAIPLGIGLMIVGAAELATEAVLGWETLPNNIKQTLTIIGLAVSAALLVLGACLTFTGAAIPLGIALLVLGAAGLVTTAKIGWNTMSDKVKNTISIITAIVSAALLALGIIFICTGVGIPLGIALIVLGAAGLATVAAVNWEWVKDKLKTVLSAALAIISGFGLVLGILLCLTGAGVPLGIALIFASIKGVQAASDIDDNPITRFIKKMVNGIIGIFESGVNFIIKMLNKLSWEVPDWVPLIGGSTFGFNIKPISIPRLKNGGFPDGEDGLFYANHNELVGKFSNGKTAVANNDQIVEGIRSGVYDANQEQNNLLREQNKLLRQLVEKDFGSGEIGVTTITNAINKKNRRDGKTLVPVGT